MDKLIGSVMRRPNHYNTNYLLEVMGGIIKKHKRGQHGNGNNPQENENEQQNLEESQIYGENVIDLANLAMTIKNEDLTSNLELYIQCENLPKMDMFSLTDAVVVLYVEKNGYWVQNGSTEIINDDLNPKFMKTLIVPYLNDKPQKLKFEVYDDDEGKENKDGIVNCNLEFIASIVVDIQEILCAASQTITRGLLNPSSNRNSNGNIIIRGVEYDSDGMQYQFKCGLKGFTSKCDVYIIVNINLQGQDNLIPLCVTNQIKNKKKDLILFSPFYIKASKFQQSLSMNRLQQHGAMSNNASNEGMAQVVFQVMEINKKKQKAQLGECEILLDNIRGKENEGKYLIAMKNGLQVGQIFIERMLAIEKKSFLNYIYTGSEIQLIVATDFTNSNLELNDPSSLHYQPLQHVNQNAQQQNDQHQNPAQAQNQFTATNTNQSKQYQETKYSCALRDILGLLQYFDSDNKIPGYGFGAKLPPYFDVVSHCFSLNGNFFKPEVVGMDAIIQNYFQTAALVHFHGPTVFSEIIKIAQEYSRSSFDTEIRNQLEMQQQERGMQFNFNSNQTQNKAQASNTSITQGQQSKRLEVTFSPPYFMLLILTDSSREDFFNDRITKKLLSSNVNPLSVAVIGVGQAPDEEDDTEAQHLNEQEKQENPEQEEQLQEKEHNSDQIKQEPLFIYYDHFKHDQKRLFMEVVRLLPQQFLDYIDYFKKQIEKTKAGQLSNISFQTQQKVKNITQAAHEFVSNKIRHFKLQRQLQINKENDKLWLDAPQFLEEKQEEFIQKLLDLQYDSSLVEEVVLGCGVMANDVKLAGEVISELKMCKLQISQMLMHNNTNKNQFNITNLERDNNQMGETVKSNFYKYNETKTSWTNLNDKKIKDLPLLVRQDLIEGQNIQHRVFKVRENKFELRQQKLQKKQIHIQQTQIFLNKIDPLQYAKSGLLPEAITKVNMAQMLYQHNLNQGSIIKCKRKQDWNAVQSTDANEYLYNNLVNKVALQHQKAIKQMDKSKFLKEITSSNLNQTYGGQPNTKQQFLNSENMCLQCGVQKIQVFCQPCSHGCFCFECQERIGHCGLCNIAVQKYLLVGFDDSMIKKNRLQRVKNKQQEEDEIEERNDEQPIKLIKQQNQNKQQLILPEDVNQQNNIIDQSEPLNQQLSQSQSQQSVIPIEKETTKVYQNELQILNDDEGQGKYVNWERNTSFLNNSLSHSILTQQDQPETIKQSTNNIDEKKKCFNPYTIQVKEVVQESVAFDKQNREHQINLHNLRINSDLNEQKDEKKVHSFVIQNEEAYDLAYNKQFNIENLDMLIT